MTTEENKALLRRAWDEIYGQGRLDSVEEFVLEDVVAHEPAEDVRGIEELKRNDHAGFWVVVGHRRLMPENTV